MKRLFFFVWVVIPCVATGQDPGIDLTYEVALQVSADEVYESQVYSRIARELRSIEDIEVTSESQADYKLAVVLVETNGGFSAGVLVHYIIRYSDIRDAIISDSLSKLKPDDFFDFKQQLETDFDSSFTGMALQIYTHNAGELEYFSVFTDGDLTSLCNRIAADIDYDIFEKKRKGMQILMD